MSKRRHSGFIIFVLFLVAAVIFAAYYFGASFLRGVSPKHSDTYAQVERVAAEYDGEVSGEEIKKLLDNVDRVPSEYIDLLLRNPETLPFVAGYFDERASIDVANEVRDAAFLPYFIQWDRRWGYLEYGKEPIAIAGCGPSALAMVAAGLTKNTDINPKSVADFAFKSGYYAGEAGTSWTLMSEGCENYGIKAQEVPLDENVIKNVLKSGTPIIASMKAGTFTQTGHFIVMTGVSEDGNFLILDPNSPKKTAQTWNYSVFKAEARNFWQFALVD